MDVMQQSAWLVFNSVMVGSNDFLFNYTTVGQILDSRTVPT